MPDGPIFCSHCNNVINHLWKSVVDKHFEAVVHKQNVERNKSGKLQTMKNRQVNAYQVKINLFLYRCSSVPWLRSHKFQVNPQNSLSMQNSTKLTTCWYNIFKTFLGCWGRLLAVNLYIYCETLEWVNNIQNVPSILRLVLWKTGYSLWPQANDIYQKRAFQSNNFKHIWWSKPVAQIFLQNHQFYKNNYKKSVFLFLLLLHRLTLIIFEKDGKVAIFISKKNQPDMGDLTKQLPLTLKRHSKARKTTRKRT